MQKFYLHDLKSNKFVMCEMSTKAKRNELLSSKPHFLFVMMQRTRHLWFSLFSLQILVSLTTVSIMQTIKH